MPLHGGMKPAAVNPAAACTFAPLGRLATRYRLNHSQPANPALNMIAGMANFDFHR